MHNWLENSKIATERELRLLKEVCEKKADPSKEDQLELDLDEDT